MMIFFLFNSEEIVGRQNQLNQRWGDLRERSEAKREELASAHGVQTFHIECRETVTWIEDKMRVLEQTDELKMDLTGIMTLQRKLTGTNLRSLNLINSINSSSLSSFFKLYCFIATIFNIIAHSRDNLLTHAKFLL